MKRQRPWENMKRYDLLMGLLLIFLWEISPYQCFVGHATLPRRSARMRRKRIFPPPFLYNENNNEDATNGAAAGSNGESTGNGDDYWNEYQQHPTFPAFRVEKENEASKSSSYFGGFGALKNGSSSRNNSKTVHSCYSNGVNVGARPLEVVNGHGIDGALSYNNNSATESSTSGDDDTCHPHSPFFVAEPSIPLTDVPPTPPLPPSRSAPLISPEVNDWTEAVTKLAWGSSGGRNGGTGHRSPRRSPSEAVAAANLTYYTNMQLSNFDIFQIERYWDRLLPVVNYLGTQECAQIYQALCVAYRAHREQRRKSGEPYIIHPVEVAILLGGLKMDGQTVMAGLLHDTVEDTDLTFAQIEALFGHTVRSIVEGETKVSKLPKLAFTEYADEQAENLRQMFVAMTDDYRIIIVKLADRLHNMRTLQHMKPEKQIKISRETLDIFAPLAHRMGIWQFKAELEDTAFMYLYPQEYKRLDRRLQQHQAKYRETLESAQALVQRQLHLDPTLRQQASKVEVFGRTKEIYSLWHKMETKNETNLDDIVDVVALRVIITPLTPLPAHKSDDDDEYDDEEQKEADRGVWLCYHVLGLVQHLPGFVPVPTRVKDYISFPKPNGYQSLHTALVLNGQTIEVQIRTSMMHQVAEFGMASHWAYTDSKRRGDRAELYNTPWLSSIKEWQNDMISSRDFVDSVRRELLGKRVFVFLRNGKILNLARGATAIDAAFQIHTEVGLTMHGVEINGRPVPLSYELQNGDVVSILTGKGRPATDWMRYAKSRSTRSKLRSYFRARQKESLREAGRILLMDYLSTHGRLIERASELDDFVVPSDADDAVRFMGRLDEYEDLDALLVDIGKQHDRVMLHAIVSRLFNVSEKVLLAADQARRSRMSVHIVAAVNERQNLAKSAARAANLGPGWNSPPFGNTQKPVISSLVLRGSFNHAYSLENVLVGLGAPLEYADPEHLCEHCLPVQGDQIVGTRPPDPSATTTVHRLGCPHAQRAINHATARPLPAPRAPNGDLADLPADPKVDSVSLRQRKVREYTKRANGLARGGYTSWEMGAGRVATASKYTSNSKDVPVRLRWSDMDARGTQFVAEIVVHAKDRKLLLADCSEVVSEESEIVKTGSQSNDETATLVYVVHVNNLGHLQNLMDKLAQIRNVYSVERRFGSELLPHP